MSEPEPRRTLPRSVRVRSRKDFQRIFRQRLRASDDRITLYAGANDVGLARLGISVSRRVGHAVRRNRIKRLVRQAFRHIRHELPAGSDWIIVPRPGPEPTVAELQESIRRLAHRLHRRLPTAPTPPGRDKTAPA